MKISTKEYLELIKNEQKKQRSLIQMIDHFNSMWIRLVKKKTIGIKERLACSLIWRDLENNYSNLFMIRYDSTNLILQRRYYKKYKIGEFTEWVKCAELGSWNYMIRRSFPWYYGGGEYKIWLDNVVGEK